MFRARKSVNCKMFNGQLVVIYFLKPRVDSGTLRGGTVPNGLMTQLGSQHQGVLVASWRVNNLECETPEIGGLNHTGEFWTVSVILSVCACLSVYQLMWVWY